MIEPEACSTCNSSSMIGHIRMKCGCFTHFDCLTSYIRSKSAAFIIAHGGGFPCPNLVAGSCALPVSYLITCNDIDEIIDARRTEEAKTPAEGVTTEAEAEAEAEAAAEALEAQAEDSQLTLDVPLSHGEVDKIRRWIQEAKDASQLLINDEFVSPYVVATTKKCPGCQFRVSHFLGHECHHIMGCPNCTLEWCYKCEQSERQNESERGARSNCLCGGWSSYCSSGDEYDWNDLVEHLDLTPFPVDKRCFCAVCPNCRVNKPCGSCMGDCPVCRGIIQPGPSEMSDTVWSPYSDEQVRRELEKEIRAKQKEDVQPLIRLMDDTEFEKGKEAALALLTTAPGMVNYEFDNCQTTPLIHAVKHYNLKWLSFLLEQPAVNVALRDENGLTAFLWAVTNGRVGIVKQLGARDDCKSAQDSLKASESALRLALGNEADDDMIQALLELPFIDERVEASDGKIAFHEAVSGPSVHLSTVALLLKHNTARIYGGGESGCSIVNLQDRHGATPLMSLASSFSRENYLDRPSQYQEALRVATLLLSQPGLNVNVANKAGRTALALAASKDFAFLVTALLAREDVDPTLANSSGSTPLLWALRGGKASASAQVLLTCSRVKLDAVEGDTGKTALMYAAQKNDVLVLAAIIARIRSAVTAREKAKGEDDIGKDTKGTSLSPPLLPTPPLPPSPSPPHPHPNPHPEDPGATPTARCLNAKETHKMVIADPSQSLDVVGAASGLPYEAKGGLSIGWVCDGCSREGCGPRWCCEADKCCSDYCFSCSPAPASYSPACAGSETWALLSHASSEGKTALHFALESGSTEASKLLLSLSDDIIITAEMARRVLHDRNDELLEICLRRGRFPLDALLDAESEAAFRASRLFRGSTILMKPTSYDLVIRKGPTVNYAEIGVLSRRMQVRCSRFDGAFAKLTPEELRRLSTGHEQHATRLSMPENPLTEGWICQTSRNECCLEVISASDEPLEMETLNNPYIHPVLRSVSKPSLILGNVPAGRNVLCTDFGGRGFAKIAPQELARLPNLPAHNPDTEGFLDCKYLAVSDSNDLQETACEVGDSLLEVLVRGNLQRSALVLLKRQQTDGSGSSSSSGDNNSNNTKSLAIAIKLKRVAIVSALLKTNPTWLTTPAPAPTFAHAHISLPPALLSNGDTPSPSPPPARTETPLLAAIKTFRSRQLFETLVRVGPGPGGLRVRQAMLDGLLHCCDEFGLSALMWAVALQQEDTVHTLLQLSQYPRRDVAFGAFAGTSALEVAMNNEAIVRETTPGKTDKANRILLNLLRSIREDGCRESAAVSPDADTSISAWVFPKPSRHSFIREERAGKMLAAALNSITSSSFSSFPSSIQVAEIEGNVFHWKVTIDATTTRSEEVKSKKDANSSNIDETVLLVEFPWNFPASLPLVRAVTSIQHESVSNEGWVDASLVDRCFRCDAAALRIPAAAATTTTETKAEISAPVGVTKSLIKCQHFDKAEDEREASPAVMLSPSSIFQGMKVVNQHPSGPGPGHIHMLGASGVRIATIAEVDELANIVSLCYDPAGGDKDSVFDEYVAFCDVRKRLAKLDAEEVDEGVNDESALKIDVLAAIGEMLRVLMPRTSKGSAKEGTHLKAVMSEEPFETRTSRQQAVSATVLCRVHPHLLYRRVPHVSLGSDSFTCGECCKPDPSKASKAYCPERHVMEVVQAFTDNRPFICDSCENDIDPNALRLTCQRCDYDVCDTCAIARYGVEVVKTVPFKTLRQHSYYHDPTTGTDLCVFCVTKPEPSAGTDEDSEGETFLMNLSAGKMNIRKSRDLNSDLVAVVDANSGPFRFAGITSDANGVWAKWAVAMPPHSDKQSQPPRAPDASPPCCPASHAMGISDTVQGPYEDGWSCATCSPSQQSAAGTARFLCRDCEYNTCFACAGTTRDETLLERFDKITRSEGWSILISPNLALNFELSEPFWSSVHGHPLQLWKEQWGWTCDGNGGRCLNAGVSTRGKLRLRCEECDFDLCLCCAQKFGQGRSLCGNLDSTTKAGAPSAQTVSHTALRDELLALLHTDAAELMCDKGEEKGSGLEHCRGQHHHHHHHHHQQQQQQQKQQQQQQQKQQQQIQFQQQRTEQGYKRVSDLLDRLPTSPTSHFWRIVPGLVLVELLLKFSQYSGTAAEEVTVRLLTLCREAIEERQTQDQRHRTEDKQAVPGIIVSLIRRSVQRAKEEEEAEEEEEEKKEVVDEAQNGEKEGEKASAEAEVDTKYIEKPADEEQRAEAKQKAWQRKVLYHRSLLSTCRILADSWRGSAAGDWRLVFDYVRQLMVFASTPSPYSGGGDDSGNGRDRSRSRGGGGSGDSSRDRSRETPRFGRLLAQSVRGSPLAATPATKLRCSLSTSEGSFPDEAVKLLGECAECVFELASARVVVSRGEADDSLVVEMIALLGSTLTSLLQQVVTRRLRDGGAVLGACEHLTNAQKALWPVFHTPLAHEEAGGRGATAMGRQNI